VVATLSRKKRGVVENIVKPSVFFANF